MEAQALPGCVGIGVALSKQRPSETCICRSRQLTCPRR